MHNEKYVMPLIGNKEYIEIWKISHLKRTFVLVAATADIACTVL